MADVVVLAALDARGELEATSLENLTAARLLDPGFCAVVLGAHAAAAAPAIAAYGADTVYVGDDAAFDEYLGDPATLALESVVGEVKPRLVLFASDYDARDVAGRLQASLGCTLVAGVRELLALDRVQVVRALRLWPGRPGNLRGGVGGAKSIEVAHIGPGPMIVLTETGATDPSPSPGRGEVIDLALEIPSERRRVRRVARHVAAADGVKLEEAKVVISGGRGLGDPANFSVLRELAAVLGNTAVGATRPVVDAGWVPYSMQVGLTGKTVRPEIYLAVGISGAAQHVAGMKGAHRVIAINKDLSAPIFQLADLGVVGDAVEIMKLVLEGVSDG